MKRWDNPIQREKCWRKKRKRDKKTRATSRPHTHSGGGGGGGGGFHRPFNAKPAENRQL